MTEIATALSTAIRPGDSIGLMGPLGAGKTEFVRELARSLKVQEEVTSPSFVLEQRYLIPATSNWPNGGTLHHWDLYRNATDAPSLGLLDSLRANDSLVVVEWPERLSGMPRLLSLIVELDYETLPSNQAEEVRSVRLTSFTESALSERTSQIKVFAEEARPSARLRNT